MTVTHILGHPVVAGDSVESAEGTYTVMSDGTTVRFYPREFLGCLSCMTRVISSRRCGDCVDDLSCLSPLIRECAIPEKLFLFNQANTT